jgi:hypothetical protein
MQGLNQGPGLLQRLQWQSNALTTRLNLIPCSTTSHTQSARSRQQSTKSRPHSARIPGRLDLIHSRLDLIQSWLYLIHTRLNRIHTPQSSRSHPHSARYHPYSARSQPRWTRFHLQSARSHPPTISDLIHSRLGLIPISNSCFYLRRSVLICCRKTVFRIIYTSWLWPRRRSGRHRTVYGESVAPHSFSDSGAASITEQQTF